MTQFKDMSRCTASFGWLDVALSFNRLVHDSAQVILHRTMDMASGRMDREEAQRMVTEKPFAFAMATQIGLATAVTGGSPSWIAESAMDHIGRTAADNADRLSNK